MAEGLRARQKAQTRASISAIAMQLFNESSFDDITIGRIAEVANVSKMTVTNYFPRKEDLVFDQTDETVHSLAYAIQRRPRGASLLDAVRHDFETRIANQDATLGPPGMAFASIVSTSRALTSRGREIADLREHALAAAIAAETGHDDLLQRVAAAQLASVHRTTFRETSRRILEGETREAVFAALSRSASCLFGTIEPGLKDYLTRP